LSLCTHGEWKYSSIHSYPQHYTRASCEFNAVTALRPVREPLVTMA
jgi:hypothetical protein